MVTRRDLLLKHLKMKGDVDTGEEENIRGGRAVDIVMISLQLCNDYISHKQYFLKLVISRVVKRHSAFSSLPLGFKNCRVILKKLKFDKKKFILFMLLTVLLI